MSAVLEAGRVPGAVMRIHGGKWRLAEHVIRHFPPHRTYIEAYGGGASVLMRKPRSHSEVYNDLDGQLVNVFRVLQDDASRERLCELCVLTPYAREEFELSYEACDDPVEQARRTILRGFMGCSTSGTTGGHRTGFRYSDRGGTCAQTVWARYPERIAAFGRRLAGVVIEHRPALELMRARMDHSDGPETLWYLDPPYLWGTRQVGSHWRRAYRHEMTDDDHRELAEVAHEVTGMVVISGYPSELYEELYRDWLRVQCGAHADGQRARTEVLWISPRAARRLNGRLAI